MIHYKILFLDKIILIFLDWNKITSWIDNPNPKYDFDFGLSITIQYTKLDCNPDWATQSSNTLDIPDLKRI